MKITLAEPFSGVMVTFCNQNNVFQKRQPDQDTEARSKKKQEDTRKTARTDHEVNIPSACGPAELS